MSKVARTLCIYSIYLFFMGACLVVVPNLLLGMLGFQLTSDIWIRLLGLFTFTVGFYYFQSSRHEQIEFFKATIVGRFFFFFMTIAFVFVFNQSATLAAIGSVDLLGALWTWCAMRSNSKSDKN